MVHIVNIILLTVSFSAFGMGNRNGFEQLIDSLKQELELVHNDSVKVQLILQIADSYINGSPDSAIFYSRYALKFAKQTNNLPAQMGAMAFEGGALINQGNLPKALELGLKAIELGKDQPVQISGGVGPNYSNLGDLYFQIGNYDKALNYFKKMSAMGDKDIVGVAFGYYEIANVYEQMNQLDSAKVYLDKSYQTFGTLN